MLDVQWLTPHLESLGAEIIGRAAYLERLPGLAARPIRRPGPGNGVSAATRWHSLRRGGLHIRVIAGIDLSVIGRRVAERGRIVAETSSASLRLVHVLDPLADAMIPQSLVKLVDEHREQAAHNTLSWVKGRTDVPVDLHVIKGSPAWEMVRLAKQGDLAIVGNSNLDTARIGPVAADVARMASSDVLIVRRQPRAPYRRAIAAVDFSEASKAAVQQVLERFPDAEVTACSRCRPGSTPCCRKPASSKRRSPPPAPSGSRSRACEWRSSSRTGREGCAPSSSTGPRKRRWRRWSAAGAPTWCRWRAGERARPAWCSSARSPKRSPPPCRATCSSPECPRRSADPDHAGRHSSEWLLTLMTVPSGARTKNRRKPQGSMVSG